MLFSSEGKAIRSTRRTRPMGRRSRRARHAPPEQRRRVGLHAGGEGRSDGAHATENGYGRTPISNTPAWPGRLGMNRHPGSGRNARWSARAGDDHDEVMLISTGGC
jgi:hypothetical protein